MLNRRKDKLKPSHFNLAAKNNDLDSSDSDEDSECHISSDELVDKIEMESDDIEETKLGARSDVGQGGGSPNKKTFRSD